MSREASSHPSEEVGVSKHVIYNSMVTEFKDMPEQRLVHTHLDFVNQFLFCRVQTLLVGTNVG